MTIGMDGRGVNVIVEVLVGVAVIIGVVAGGDALTRMGIFVPFILVAIVDGLDKVEVTVGILQKWDR